MMSSRKLKNEMQGATNNNLCQVDWPDLPNNVKIDHSGKDKEVIKTICNDFTNPPSHETAITQDVDIVTVLRCDAEEDGKCQGEIEVYKHFHFTCLAADVPGQPSTHNFCKYHYDSATTYCPVHPCFHRTK